ncbi:MAG: response regulator transcription factor [Anaerolineae bacterium]|nr:response regulator transcription factor [Anaerolineae bacterium]
MMNSAIHVLIVDDHTMVRAGLRMFLENTDNIEFIGEAATGDEAVAFCKENPPDVILMDIKMQTMDGVEATRRILLENPSIRIIALTSFKDDYVVHSALKAGAVGYLLKDATPEDIERAILDAMQDSGKFDKKMIQSLLKSTSDNPLSERENAVLKLMTAGMTNQEIAEKLVITQSTVKFHVSNILVKLNVNTRTEAVAFALQHHFFDGR